LRQMPEAVSRAASEGATHSAFDIDAFDGTLGDSVGDRCKEGQKDEQMAMLEMRVGSL
jgi:hypothetical protein